MSGFYDFKVYSVLETDEVLKLLQGEGAAGLLVISRTEDDTTELNTLTEKILGAAGFAVHRDAYQLKTGTEKGFSLRGLQTGKDIKNVLVFGFKPAFLGLNWNLAEYRPFTRDEVNYLFADNLQKLSEDKALKGKLWSCLQLMFPKE